MKGKISHTLIANLKPADKPFEVRDTQLKGLLLRVQPSGVITFYVEWARGKRINLGRADAVTPAQAREQAKVALADAYKGNDPSSPKKPPKDHTLGTFFDELYEPWAQANLRTHAATMARLRANFGDMLDKRLSGLTLLDIEKWRAGRIKGGTKAATVNRDIDDLRAALNKAALWLKDFSNPIAAVKRIKTDTKGKVRFLTPDEEKRLRKAVDDREERIRLERDSANAWRKVRGYDLLPDIRLQPFADYLKPMVLLSLNTGMRRGEVFGLCWSEVDLGRRETTIVGEKAKSGQTRHIPLNDEAMAVLADWKAQSDGSALVFPGKDGRPFDNVRKSWDAVLVAAEIEDFRWHDLRHTFASKLVMAGVDLNTVRELLGHSDIKMTLRYAQPCPGAQGSGGSEAGRASSAMNDKPKISDELWVRIRDSGDFEPVAPCLREEYEGRAFCLPEEFRDELERLAQIKWRTRLYLLERLDMLESYLDKINHMHKVTQEFYELIHNVAGIGDIYNYMFKCHPDNIESLGIDSLGTVSKSVRDEYLYLRSQSIHIFEAATRRAISTISAEAANIKSCIRGRRRDMPLDAILTLSHYYT